MAAETRANDTRTEPIKQEHPHSCPCKCRQPLESEDTGEVKVEGSNVVDVVGGDGLGDLQENGGQGPTVGPEVVVNLVPGVMDGGLEAQGGGIQVPVTVQSGEIEMQVGPSQH